MDKYRGLSSNVEVLAYQIGSEVWPDWMRKAHADGKISYANGYAVSIKKGPWGYPELADVGDWVVCYPGEKLSVFKKAIFQENFTKVWVNPPLKEVPMDKYREKSSGEIVEVYQVAREGGITEWVAKAIQRNDMSFVGTRLEIRKSAYGPVSIFPGDWLVYRPSDKSYGGYSDGGFNHFFEKVPEEATKDNPVSYQIKKFLDNDISMSANELFSLLRASAKEIDRLTKAMAESKEEWMKAEGAVLGLGKALKKGLEPKKEDTK